MKVRLAVNIALILCSFWSVGQDTKLRAERFYNNYLFQRAANEFERHLESSPDDQEAMLMMADCYVRLHIPEKAIKYYEQTINQEGIDVSHYFKYAEALTSTNKLDEAKKWYKKYQSSHGNSQLAKEKLDGLKHHNAFYKDSSRYHVINFPFNSAEVDFAPAFFKGGLLYSSDRIHDNSHSHDPHYDHRKFVNLYYLKDGEQTAHNFASEINSKFHETGISFNEAENKMFFTKSISIHRKPEEFDLGSTNIKLFVAELIDNKWKETIAFEHNSDKYSVFDPCVSQDFKHLYFASDMPGGFGGSDLYVCHWKDNSWSKPINLGPKINSAGNERSPFLTPTGTLFFASDGHAGLGGLDLYVTHKLNYTNLSEYEGGNKDDLIQFEDIKNLGYPVNTPGDDFSLIIHSDDHHGYFASDRKGGKGNDDIYHVTFK